MANVAAGFALAFCVVLVVAAVWFVGSGGG